MIEVLKVETMRESDARTIAAGTPGRDLMSRAAAGIFNAVSWKPPVAILCGSGNNGGDGYALAELLQAAAIPCRIIRLSDRLSPDGAYFLDRCRAAGVPESFWSEGPSLSEDATLVDCIFGTGFRGEPAGAEREAILAINAAREAGAFVVSVDINSGLHGNSGRGDPCVLSDLTVSIGSFQPGHFLGRAKDVMRQKTNVDIGIAPVAPPIRLLEPADLAPLFPPRLHDSHKGTYGYCALIGGSLRYGGAIRLAAMANGAMRSGAGVVRVALPRSLAPAVLPNILESTLFPLPDQDGEISFSPDALSAAVAGCKSAAIGMGIGLSEDAGKAVSFLLKEYSGTLIVDADGLTHLSRLPRPQLRDRRAPLILTPHPKEFSRLSGLSLEEVLQNPFSAAEAYAADTGAIVLLKGSATVITDGETTYLSDTGCPGMATAGSGDVLSGILTALAARAQDPLLATAAAAYLNGLAGELAQARVGATCMVASDTVASIPDAVLQITAAASI